MIRRPQLNSFESVAARAGDLAWREKSAAAWEDFVGKLRDGAKISYNTALR